MLDEGAKFGSSGRYLTGFGRISLGCGRAPVPPATGFALEPHFEVRSRSGQFVTLRDTSRMRWPLDRGIPLLRGMHVAEMQLKEVTHAGYGAELLMAAHYVHESLDRALQQHVHSPGAAFRRAVARHVDDVLARRSKRLLAAADALRHTPLCGRRGVDAERSRRPARGATVSSARYGGPRNKWRGRPVQGVVAGQHELVCTSTSATTLMANRARNTSSAVFSTRARARLTARTPRAPPAPTP